MVIHKGEYMSKSNLEKKLIAETRKLKYNFSNDTDYDVVCKLCGMKCKCWCNFGRHLKITHNTNSEEYYKVFYKNVNEGICKECGNPTKFYSILLGYAKFCSQKCSANNTDTRKKCENTNKKTYGVKYTIQNEKCRQKLEETNIKKYGVKWNMSNSDIRQKAAKTKLELYGNENYNNIDKIKTTWYNRDDNFKEKVKNKREKTCIKKYGVSSYLKTDEFKKLKEEWCLSNYGVNNYSKTQEYKDKYKNTCNKKYGVDSYTKTFEYHHKARKKYKYDNIYFDSSWKLAYYIWLKDNNIDFEYHPDIDFKYFDETNKERTYFPDFKVGECIIEIKSDYLLDVNNKNHERLEKLELIKLNNIVLFTYKDIKPFLNYVKIKYGKDFLKSCKKV